jgi:hypothetical protein
MALNHQEPRPLLSFINEGQLPGLTPCKGIEALRDNQDENPSLASDNLNGQ